MISGSSKTRSRFHANSRIDSRPGTSAACEIAAVEQELFEAIKFFEPRIIPGTLSVRAVGDFEKIGPNCLGFEIRGELWASPMPEQLYIRTQIDLDTGECLL